MQFRFQKSFNIGFCRPQIVRVMMRDHKIICVTDVTLSFQIVLYKEIQFVEIDIGEELRSEVADWATALSLSLSLS